MTKPSRALGRSLLLCFLIGWLGVYASLLSTVSNRFALQFAMPETDAGLFISAHAIGMLISVLLSGSLADSMGKRRIVLISTAVMVLGLFITFFPPRCSWSSWAFSSPAWASAPARPSAAPC